MDNMFMIKDKIYIFKKNSLLKYYKNKTKIFAKTEEARKVNDVTLLSEHGLKSGAAHISAIN